MRTSLIVAADEGDVIGRGNDLPWDLPEDRRLFRDLTLGHALIAGARTHESIVGRLGHPLGGRLTVVVTRRATPSADPRVVFQPDVPNALAVARAAETLAGRDEIFVIGGAQLYAQTLDQVDRIYLTRVQLRTEGDAAMPPGWLKPFTLVDEQRPAPDKPFSLLIYDRG